MILINFLYQINSQKTILSYKATEYILLNCINLHPITIKFKELCIISLQYIYQPFLSNVSQKREIIL